MDALIHDLKYGVRMLLKAPALTLVAVLTIALGVGLTTHTFSVVYGAMLRGLDFDRGTTLVQLAEENVSEGERGNSVPLLLVHRFQRRLPGYFRLPSGMPNLRCRYAMRSRIARRSLCPLLGHSRSWLRKMVPGVSVKAGFGG
jgi:hypothetical protein